MTLAGLRAATFDAVLTTAIGLLLFVLAWWALDKAAPFSLKTALGARKNSAVAIILFSVLLGLGIIVSAAVQG
jgi:putative membrane protein